jgi:hypothetical protein
MLVSCQNAGQHCDIKTANGSFENVSQFKHLGTIVGNQNIQKEIKRRLNSGNACYHSVQDILSSRLLSKNAKFFTYNTIILPVVLYEDQTWSLTLREAHRLRLFESRVLRRIFGPKRDEVAAGWRQLHNEELRNLCSSPSIIRMLKCIRMRRAGHVVRMGGGTGKNKGYRWESQREDHEEDQGVGGWIILRWILKR